MTPQRVVVLGGSGFVGRSVCRRLAARWPGLRVCVPTRRLGHAAALRLLPGIEPVQADVHDDGALARLVADADAVVQLVAILHGREADFERVHVGLPQRVAVACRGAGVARLVHVSAIGVAADAPSMYLRSKARGEAVLAASRVPVSVLRPSVIFGAEDRFMHLFAALQAWSPLLPLAGRNARMQPVWVEDVGEAILRVLEGHAPPLLECTGPREYSLGELASLAGRWAGHERAQIGLPEPLARLQARLLEMAPGPTLMSRDNLESLRVPNVASGTLPGLQALGIAPAALEDVMPSLVAGKGPRSHLDALRRHAAR